MADIHDLKTKEENDFYREILRNVELHSMDPYKGFSLLSPGWYGVMTSGFISKYSDYIDWKRASKYCDFNDNMVKMFWNNITPEILDNDVSDITTSTAISLKIRFKKV